MSQRFFGGASRPGAWLADFIHTFVAIEKGDVKSKAIYSVVHTSTYVWLCKELGQKHSFYCSANSIGNVFEWLVWAACEEKRYDFIASLMAHCTTGPSGPSPMSAQALAALTSRKNKSRSRHHSGQIGDGVRGLSTLMEVARMM